MACDALPYEIDQFPVPIDPAAGVPLLLAAPGDETPVRVVLDTGAPLTLLDGPETTRTRAPLTLFGHTTGEPIPRARFISAEILHRPITAIGPESAGFAVYPIAGTVGGDLLSTLAMRVDMGAGQIRLFSDIATRNERFYQEGHAVLRSPPSGGGTFQLDGAIVAYPPSRLVLPVCLDQRPISADVQPVEDALLVLATGFDRTVLTASAYTRARRTSEPGYTPDFRFEQPYHLPGAVGPVLVHMDFLERVALADDEHDNRGGCDEVFLNRLMQRGGCPLEGACPCPDENATRCKAGSTVEIVDPIPVAVIPDDDPLLLGVREELRPRYADIDGFLGAGVLRGTIYDLDYPGGRIIVRCAVDTCRTDRRVDPD